jgi:Protein of unknown function (DUF3987)
MSDASLDARALAELDKTAGTRLSQRQKDAAAAEVDNHRNTPQPSDDCLYGLIGDIARAGSKDTEANPFAIAANALAYMSAAVGRACFMAVGNVWHHARINTAQVGRSALGRKGEAASLIHRIDKALRQTYGDSMAPQVHRGGLSTREGLVLLIHDGFAEGRRETPPIDDKRLWVLESEFANVLAQARRDGNTLSTALRDVWDGVSIRPAVKTSRIYATDPHIALSVAITPSELCAKLSAGELSNGFANRFMFLWAERTRLLPFPRATTQSEVNDMAGRVAEVIRFAQGDKSGVNDTIRVELSAEAVALWVKLYSGELNARNSGERVNALLDRRPPTLLRIAMLLALTDKTATVQEHHINAALAWIRYWSDSVRFIFASDDDEAASAELSDLAERIVGFLGRRGQASRKGLTVECFGGHQSKDKIDVALDELLHATPPRITVETVPRADAAGTPTKVYRLAANCAKSANCEQGQALAPDSSGENSANSANCDRPDDNFSSLDSHSSLTANRPQSRTNAHGSQSSHTSHAGAALAAGDLDSRVL